MGHILTDPKCPQYRKDNCLHAQRIIEVNNSGNEVEEKVPEEPPQEDDPENNDEGDELLEELPPSDYEDEYPIRYDSPSEVDWDKGPQDNYQLYVMHVEPMFTNPDEEVEHVLMNIIYDAQKILQSFQLEATSEPANR